jgi:hypothetical protein
VFDFAAVNPLTLTVSLADQRFEQVKSLGILNVSLGLCNILAQSPKVKRLTLLTNPSLPPIQSPGSDRVVLMECAGKTAGKFRRLWWDQFGVYRAARRAGNEWLLLPKGYASSLQRSPVRLATYVHDVMQEYYHEHHPRGFPPFENFYFHAGLRAAIARSQVILTNTQSTAAEIERVAVRYRIKSPRIAVVGIGFERPPQVAPAPRTHIVVLASPWPHKRADLASQYLFRWQEQRRYAGLVDWVGQLPAGLTFPKAANWHLHGRLAQDDWNRLLAETKALVYFSEYEGFAMPLVESVLAGACPVYSDLSATREVMQGTGCSFSNVDYASFAAALDKAQRRPESEIKDWADQLLARHNWQAVGERVIQVLA